MNWKYCNYLLAGIFAILLSLVNSYGQSTIKLTFTSTHNNFNIPLDSIKVINVSKKDTCTLYWPDTTITLGVVGINENNSPNQLLITQNYPNPFKDQTNFDIKLPKAGKIIVNVTNIAGKLVASYDKELTKGMHSFLFKAGREKAYFLNVKFNNESRSIKMFYSGNTTQSESQLIYAGTKNSGNFLKSGKSVLQSNIDNFQFTSGDTLEYISYVTSGQIYYGRIVDVPLVSKNYTFETEWEHLHEPLVGLGRVYNTLYFDGLYKRMYPMLMDVKADDVRSVSPWIITPVEAYTNESTNHASFVTWDVLYAGIYRANQVLEYVPPLTMEASLKTRVLGEAHFLRGLFYYHLLNLFKRVPLVTTLAKNANDFVPPLATREDLWNLAISDFSMAKEMLPSKQEYAPADSFRATKGAAAGFLGKSYMITHQWSSASNVLKELIDNGSYALMANYRDNFTLTNERNVESLFEIVYSKSLGGDDHVWLPGTAIEEATMTKTSVRATHYAPKGFGWNDVIPSDWIYQEFLKEKTVDGKRDARISTCFLYPGNDTSIYGNKTIRAVDLKNILNSDTILIRKYLNDDTRTDDWDWKSEINERILRYADILLLYAEALNELGRTFESYPYINMVRNRANLPDLTPGLSQPEMREYIAHERALEFCFEGQRYVDILRWGWLEDADKLNILRSHDPAYNTFISGRQFLPVPQQALDRNPNLTQEAGW